MTPLDAMKQALDALIYAKIANINIANVTESITNLRTAIAEMEKAEPSAYIWTNNKGWEMYASTPHDEYTNIPLFLHPAQSRDSIIEECAAMCDEVKFNGNSAYKCAAAIRALKGK